MPVSRSSFRRSIRPSVNSTTVDPRSRVTTDSVAHGAVVDAEEQVAVPVREVGEAAVGMETSSGG